MRQSSKGRVASVWAPASHPTIAEAGNPAIHFCMARPDLADRFDWALVRSFLAVLDAGSLMGAARRLRRAAAHAQPPRRRARGASSARRCSSAPAAASCPPSRRWPSPTPRARWRPARWRCRAALATARSAETRHGAHQRPARSPPPGCCRRCSRSCRREEPGIAIELVASEPAHQPAAPRGRHRRAHGAAGAGLAGGAQAGGHPASSRRRTATTWRVSARRSGRKIWRSHRLIGFDRDEAILRGFAAMGMPLHARALRAAHRRAGRLRAARRRGRGHRLRRPTTYIAPVAGRACRCCRMLDDPAAAVLAGGAPRDPRAAASCGASTTSWPRRFRAHWPSAAAPAAGRAGRAGRRPSGSGRAR